MNKLLVTAVISTLAFSVHAQSSLQDGEKMINYGRFATAQKILTPLAATDEVANYYLGVAQLDMDDTAAARATFAKYPESFYSQAGTARVLFIEGKKDDATKILNAIIDKARKKEWEKYKIAADAITYTDGGNINDAITWYQKANEINNGGDANTFIALGDAYLKIARKGGDATAGGNAMSRYEDAATKGTNNSLAYSRIGRLWYNGNNYNLALQNYDSAKQADSSNPLPYHDLAEAYQRAGRYPKALENIEQFIKLSDNSIDDQITYADLLFLSQKYPEAEAKIQELQNKGVTKPYLYRLVAYSAYETKDYAKAAQNMQIFYSKQPADHIIPEDYLYSGKIMSALAMQDTTKAKMYNDSADYYFTKVITSDTAKDKRDLYMQLVDLNKESKNYDKVGYWYGRIVADNPDASNSDYFNSGLYYYYGNDYQSAAKAFVALRTKYPVDSSNANFWQGKVAAAMDPNATTGLAAPYYKAWYDQGKLVYADKKDWIMSAYQYMTFYYYNTKNKTEAVTWANRILALNPSDDDKKFPQQVIDFFSKPEGGGAAKGKKK